jgi:DNA-directed RNA polymerase subunit K/omega
LTTQHELLDAAIKQVGNRYLATMLVAKRIRQLHHGAPAYVQRQDGESFFTVAMREIALGHVVMAPMTEDAGLASAAATPIDMEALSIDVSQSVDVSQPEEEPVESPQD